MQYFINSKVIGTDAHMNVEDGYRWTNSIPDDKWVLGDRQRIMSIDDLAELFRTEVTTFMSLPQAKFFSSLGLKPREIGWSKAIDPAVYRKTMEDLISGCCSILEDLEKSGYENTYINNQKFLRTLQGAHIDTDALERAMRLENDSTQLTNLRSFKSESGIADRVVYNTSESSTGRMKVKSGPKILTLRRDHREIIKSRFTNGEIVSIDYSSLEPRIALALQGHNPKGDVYSWIDQSVFGGKLGRSTAKIMTLSIIYGMSIHAAGRKYGKVTRGQQQQLRKIFGIDEIENLDSEYNAYGRPIYPDSDRKKFNSYIQSTAVDAAVLGFSKIYDMGCIEAVPLFVIHDELVCDVPEGYSKFLKHILSDGITVDLLGKPANLEVKVEKFGGCN